MPIKIASFSKEGPFYQPLPKQWLNKKIRHLAIDFSETFDQHTTLTGALLSKIFP